MKRILFICFFVFLVFNGCCQKTDIENDSACFKQTKFPIVTINKKLYDEFYEITKQSEKCHFYKKDTVIFFVDSQFPDSIDFKLNSVNGLIIAPYYYNYLFCLDKAKTIGALNINNNIFLFGNVMNEYIYILRMIMNLLN